MTPFVFLTLCIYRNLLYTSLVRVPRLSLLPRNPRMTFDPPEGKAEGEPGRLCHMTASMSLYILVYCRDLLGNKKTFALTAVHPAYACEATMAKEPAR